jgi:MoxR-like ATPase
VTLKARIRWILEHLSEGVYEKEEALRLGLLSALAGESIFLLGPPGVAKSLIARKLKYAFREGRSFEYLMNRFSTPDELFGPVSIRKLKDEDRYERLTEHYLPGANVVFLDEIWKAGPAIQNALLTILNERVYRNGEQEVQVNIRAIIAASNELPAQGEGLNALWDRFLVRYLITEIRRSDNFLGMITDTRNVYADSVETELKITESELRDWNEAIDKVELPPEVLNVLQIIKLKVDEYDQKRDDKFNAYDRRWKKIVRLLRTSAFLNERPEVDLMDCFLIPHCLWHAPSQLETLQEMVAQTIRKHGYTLAIHLTPLKNEIRSLEEEVKQEVMVPHVVLKDKLRLVDREFYEVLNMEQYFDGNRIKAAEFDRLSLEEDQTINLFDSRGSLTNRTKARRSAIPTEIQVRHNEKTLQFRMLSDKEELQEITYKKPHPLVSRFWDERLASLRQYIREQEQRFENELPDGMKQLRNHLFVSPEMATLVEANFKETRQSLDSLELQLDKIQHFYQSLS